jgi:hypothetical protein
MLKEVLSMTGKSGLFKLISKGKNMLIVESLIDGKRIPAYTKDKVVALSDIAIFTEDDQVPLPEVLEKVRVKEAGAICPIDPKADNAVLRKYMEEVFPEYDKERVYPSDIRKLINWYNILIQANISDFFVEDTSSPSSEA